MPLPLQAVLPLTIVSLSLIATGNLMDWTDRALNNGKAKRVMMKPFHNRLLERDLRIVGDSNVQLVCTKFPK